MSIILGALRFIFSLLLLPCCVTVTIAFYKGIVSIKSISESGLFFILGTFSYAVTHLLLFKLDFLYVLGHEVMHAIATMFSGGRVKAMKVSTKEGSLKTTTPNVAVVQAPYIVPGYTVFIALLYFSLSFFIDVTKYSRLFIFLMGFTLMFHLSYTAQSIRDKQSDLLRSNYLFSVSVIYIVNLVAVFGMISLFFKEVNFLDFLLSAYEASKNFYYSAWKQLFL